jgi:hypothetical protein
MQVLLYTFPDFENIQQIRIISGMQCDTCSAIRFAIIHVSIYNKWTSSRPQWPRGLRHELSSPAQTLGSWIRIPLEA